MTDYRGGSPTAGIFLSFSGDCREALTFYRSIFGGELLLNEYPEPIPQFGKIPVVSATLITERLLIYGSDLIATEGRRVGNHIAAFINCRNYSERGRIAEILTGEKTGKYRTDTDILLELTDVYQVHWVLGVKL